MGNLSLVFVPQFKRNPYQAQLAENLKLLGIDTEGIDHLDSLIINLAQGKKCDVLHIHWLTVFFVRKEMLKSIVSLLKLFVRLTILKAQGVRIVWTVHNLQDHENPYPHLDKLSNLFVARISDAIIVHCNVAKDKVIKAYGLENHMQKIFVIPHGNYIQCYDNTVDRIEARKTLGLDESRIVLLFLGKIRPYKGVVELVEEFKELNLPDSQLLIAGKPFDDEMRDLLERSIHNIENIKFIPNFIPDEEIQVYMNACDVVVFPYRNILTSGAVILAMSFAKPCIAPRMGCLEELLDDEGSFIYAPNVKGALMKAVAKAIARKDDLSNMGRHNFQLAQKFAWNEIARETLDVYKRSSNVK